jgi:hypothetical protein
MNASGRIGKIFWPTFILFAMGLLLLPGAIRTARAAQSHAAGALSPDPALQDESLGEDEEGGASDQLPFTVGSIAGTYASTNIGSGGQFPVADVGVFTFDGAGKFSGYANVNLETGDFRQRQVFQSPVTGTYRVAGDGTGTTNAELTLPDGTTRQTSTHFMITKVKAQAGQRIATEFKVVFDNLSFTAGNVDVAVLQKIPSGGFSKASLIGTYGFQVTGHGGWLPTADAGMITFDGQGNATVYFNQNIPGGENIPGTPGTPFFQRQVFSGNVSFTYEVNTDGTGQSDVAHFVITQAKMIDNKLVATEVFFVADDVDPFTGNLLTTIATRLSPNLNPMQGGFSVKSLNGTYGGKVIGRGGHTQQITVSALTFDGAGNFSGPGIINLPGQFYGERTFVQAPFVGTYTVRRDGFGTAVNGGESYFAVTKNQRIGGVNVATEFALVVRELQPTGNLITAIFTRLPDAGVFSAASLQGTYGTNAIGYGGQMPDAGVGTFTFDGAGNFSTSFFQNLPGSTAFDRQIFEVTNLMGTYTMDATGLAQTAFPNPGGGGNGESALVVTKATVRNGVKVADEFFVVVKDYSPLSRSIIASIGTRISD